MPICFLLAPIYRLLRRVRWSAAFLACHHMHLAPHPSFNLDNFVSRHHKQHSNHTGCATALEMADPMSDVDDPVAALCTALVTYIQHQAARENAAEAVRLDMQARIARLEASADGVRNAVNRESQQRQNAVSNAVPTSESRQTGFDATDVTGAQHHDDNPDSTAQEPPVSTRDTPTIQDGDQAAIDTPDTE